MPFPTISGFLLKGKAILDWDGRGDEIGRVLVGKAVQGWRMKGKR
jgi:hypothetical protein